MGENPAMKLQMEYQRIEIISGVFRPTRSASQPDATAPKRRSQSVKVNTIATAVSGTPNSSAIGCMMSKKMVKSKASRVQPSHAAHHARHCSVVGSFHHGSVAGMTAVTDDPVLIDPANVAAVRLAAQTAVFPRREMFPRLADKPIRAVHPYYSLCRLVSGVKSPSPGRIDPISRKCHDEAALQVAPKLTIASGVTRPVLVR